MLDGTIPPELHEKYLRIVLNETERLTKLTNSLLTLNNLNMKGMVLEKTAFDLNKVIRSTAASFEGTCQQKHIGIELVLTGEQMPVFADKSKIEQVLYNLLDNAIKFSHPESAIKIETTEKHGKVFVSVKDSGIGIPKDSLRLIFDRFYKTDLSRGKDKKGTAGACHHQRNHSGAQRKHQRHQHRGRRHGIHLLPPCGGRGIGVAAPLCGTIA